MASLDANVGDVGERLTSSGAEEGLVALALRHLSARAEERPADGARGFGS